MSTHELLQTSCRRPSHIFPLFFPSFTPKTSVGCSSGRQDSLNPPTLSAYSSNARAASGSAHFYGAQNQWEMSTMG